MTDDFDENIAAAGLRVRRQRGGGGGPDGEDRGDRRPPPEGGLAAARGRPGGVAASEMTELELFAAADAMSGVAEESLEPSPLDEIVEEQTQLARSSAEQVMLPQPEVPMRWTEITDERMRQPDVEPQEQRLLETLLDEQVTNPPTEERQPRRWRDMSTEEIIEAAVRGELSVSEEEVGTPAWGFSESDGDPDGDEGAALSGADGGAPGGGDAAALGEELPGGDDHLRGLGGGPIITPRGDRFHKWESCPALAHSQPIERRILCRDCGVRYPGVTVVFLEFNGVVHTDPQCTCIQSRADLRCLTSCMRCFAS